jgi:hypothetical protein
MTLPTCNSPAGLSHDDSFQPGQYDGYIVHAGAMSTLKRQAVKSCVIDLGHARGN